MPTTIKNKNQRTTNPLKGIVADLTELIHIRPHKAITGFAPTGKISTHQWGNNKSIFQGRGMEFAESRCYQAGVDVSNIDWRVTARTGKTYTKLFQEERERPVNLLVDMRAMMLFGTRKRFKSNLASLVSAQLAWVGHDGGDRVGGQILTPDGVKDFPATRTRQGILRFLEGLSIQTRLPSHASIESPSKVSKDKASEDIEAETENKANQLRRKSKDKPLTLAQGIHRLRKTSRSGALVFIISDLIDFDEQTVIELGRLSANTQVTIIQINDVLDKSLPPFGRISDGQAMVALENLSTKQLDSYERAYQTRSEQLYKTCVQQGMVIHQLQTTDEPSVILKPRRQR